MKKISGCNVQCLRMCLADPNAAAASLFGDPGFQALAIFLPEDGRFRALHSGSVRAKPLGPAANTRETVGMFSDVRVRGGHSSDGMGVAWSGSSDPWPLVPFDDFLHCCRPRVDDLGAECFSPGFPLASKSGDGAYSKGWGL